MDNIQLAPPETQVKPTNDDATSERESGIQFQTILGTRQSQENQIWSKLGTLQLLAGANVMIMLFALDDVEQLERVLQIHCEFQETNTTNAYQILIGIISEDMIKGKTRREIDVSDVEEFIRLRRIQSYVELRQDSWDALRVIEQHLRYIMSPQFENGNSPMYRSLFEVNREFVTQDFDSLEDNTVSGNRHNNAKDGQWVDRLYYQKPDFGQIYKYQQKIEAKRKKKLSTKKRVNNGEDYQSNLLKVTSEYSPMRGSLQAQDGPSRRQLIESSRGSETPQYSQGSRNQEELRQGRSRPQAEDRYESPSINHKSMTSRRSATPNRSQISHTHHSKPTVHCPYHCRSKSPVVEKKRDSTPQKSQKNVTNLLLMSDMNSYMSKRNINHDAQRETQYASIGQKDSETPQFIHGRPNGVQGNFTEYNSQQRSKSQNVVPPSPQNRGYQSQFKRADPPASQQNYYIPTSPRPYPPQSARTDSIQATRMISPSMVTGIENMSEEEKVRYFQRLQQNYRQSGYNNDDEAPTRPKKRGQLIPTVVEYRYIEKPQKDRGYGCSNCQIF
ncbi:hypothetical protein FGO68_gene11590 [Halteria grandinella]|uniref:Uncharacterized protein n=1 Tax=Halteria grandinella TaxID=5974 RepID=A0A8J8NE29_HALGN|nr:hypothetical protein FGO68_gene11590 [Halteria grandinella]